MTPAPANGWRQTAVLFRHFFQRLVVGESVLFEENRRESVIFQAVGLMVFGLLASHELYKKYYFLPDLDPRGCWFEMLLFFTLAMTLSGIIAVLHWEYLFLDRLDQANLGPLPIPRARLALAKFLALFAGIGIVTAVFALPAVLIFQHYVGWRLGPPAWRNGAAYLLALLLANVLVFLGVAACQGVLFLLFSGNLLRRLAISAQFLLLTGFISVFAWFPQVITRLEAWRGTGHAFLRAFPPYWLQCFGGHWSHLPAPPASDQHRLILPALVVTLGLYLACLGAQALSRGQGVQSFAAGSGSARGPRSGWPWLARLLLPGPFDRGLTSFFIRTLRRGRKQKVQFLLVFTFPLAFAITQWVHLATFPEGRAGAVSALAAIPLYLHTFLLIGIRQALRIPGGSQAHFVFQLTAPADPGRVQRGLDRAILLTAQLPLTVLLTVLLAPWWGLAAAVRYNLYALTVAVVLQKCLFYSFLRFPFCSNYVPEKFRFKVFWPFYLLVFATGLELFLWVGLGVIDRTRGFLWTVGVLLLLGALVQAGRRRRRRDQDLVFDEAPEPVMMGLGLD